MKIAMWSGPRNLSTACMYAFGNRADCAVIDEPFYAAYLAATGLDHPMRAEVLASQTTDAAIVSAALTGSNPGELPHFYQKHMAQHMVEGVPLAWMANVKNVFLIRHPARVVASFAAKHHATTLADTGFVQQERLVKRVVEMGQRALVVDSSDIRENPRGMLMSLCSALDLPWDEAMLKWPAGGRVEDGIWAAHWYGAVHRSTGFAGPEGDLPVLTGENAQIVAQAMPIYDQLRAQAISARNAD